MTLEGKMRVTTRYRDQPKTCFGCGSLDHERRDCPDNERATYAQAVAESRPEPTKTTEETFHVDADPPEVTPEVIQTTTSSESDVDERHKKERKEKKKKLKKMMEEGVFTTSTPDPKRKERSSSDTSPQHSAKHIGLPHRIATHKSQKQ